MGHQNLGERLYHKGRWAAAEDPYREALHLAPNAAFSNSALAWFRANCPDAKFRNIQEAVQLAKKATEFDPAKGDQWLTFGVACYRASQWHETVAQLGKATDLSPRDNSVPVVSGHVPLAIG